MRVHSFIIASLISLAVPAFAEEAAKEAAKETAAPAATEAKAEVKAAAGIENRMPTGEATTFAAKSTVYVWSEVNGANGQEVEHVWKKDDKEIRRAKFQVGAKRWRMNSRASSAAKGSYVVEVVLGDKVLGDVKFTVE